MLNVNHGFNSPCPRWGHTSGFTSVLPAPGGAHLGLHRSRQVPQVAWEHHSPRCGCNGRSVGWSVGPVGGLPGQTGAIFHFRPYLPISGVGKGLTPFPTREIGLLAENGISLPFARGALPRPSRCSHRSIRSPGGFEIGRRHFPAIFLWIASPPRRVLGSWSGCEINR